LTGETPLDEEIRLYAEAEEARLAELAQEERDRLAEEARLAGLTGDTGGMAPTIEVGAERTNPANGIVEVYTADGQWVPKSGTTPAPGVRTGVGGVRRGVVTRTGGRSRKHMGGRVGYQDQGRTGIEANAGVSIMDDPITQEAILFILGESDNQQAVNDFITKYGNEAFMQLRDTVLKQIAGADVQTEGQIAGVGGGMADDIPGMIGANEKIAVSQDEFIIPADVVAGLGDGSSNAGSDRLYEMMDRVRQAKTGGRTQPSKINLKKVMPA
jgi:hypothetical protein